MFEVEAYAQDSVDHATATVTTVLAVHIQHGISVVQQGEQLAKKRIHVYVVGRIAEATVHGYNAWNCSLA